MTLPPTPKDRNWSPETWRAGLDEAVRLSDLRFSGWYDFSLIYTESTAVARSTIAHATTLLDAGIVKPVVSEAEAVWRGANDAWISQPNAAYGKTAAIAVIQSALDKARAGE